MASFVASGLVVKLVWMDTLAVIQGGWADSPLWAGWTRFVPRLSWKDRALLRELPADRSTALAKALAQAGSDAQLVLQAHREPARRVVLEPEAWHNQRPLRSRTSVFRQLGPSVSLLGQLDPASLRSSSATALVDYALAFLNAEQARGADAVLPPYHLAGGHARPGRDGELRLADAAVAVARREALDRRTDAAKPLLVGIAVDAGDVAGLGPAVALARSYAGLDADGYWVQFANLSEAAPTVTVESCCAFLYALQELSGRRVFAVDVKNLVWPLLAGGLFGGCIGIGEREAWTGPENVSNERRSIKPTVVHPRLLRNFVANGPDARRAFKGYPCACGTHESDVVPAKRPDIRRHALRVRLAMAEGATGARGTAVVKSWLTDAGWAAAELGLSQPAVEAYLAALAAATGWRSAASG